MEEQYFEGFVEDWERRWDIDMLEEINSEEGFSSNGEDTDPSSGLAAADGGVGKEGDGIGGAAEEGGMEEERLGEAAAEVEGGAGEKGEGDSSVAKIEGSRGEPSLLDDHNHSSQEEHIKEIREIEEILVPAENITQPGRQPRTEQ